MTIDIDKAAARLRSTRAREMKEDFEDGRYWGSQWAAADATLRQLLEMPALDPTDPFELAKRIVAVDPELPESLNQGTTGTCPGSSTDRRGPRASLQVRRKCWHRCSRPTQPLVQNTRPDG